ncbi:MAG: hypothetical protein KJZ76_10455, partial [Burkholderiaceae bacterium]|nr:hypothetical protein [Burkholderiaceae bacterium]
MNTFQTALAIGLFCSMSSVYSQETVQICGAGPSPEGWAMTRIDKRFGKPCNNAPLYTYTNVTNYPIGSRVAGCSFT